MVHLEGPISRAQLTERTSLNRSTILDLVAELQGEQLLYERAPVTSGVGRPSPIVHASSEALAIAVNPEIDAIELAVVGLDRSVIVRERHEQATSPTPETVVQLVAQRLETWRKDTLRAARLLGIAVAIPGLVRASDGLVKLAPHLEWRDVPLGEMLSKETGLVAIIDNDATLGAMAEHAFGAARGADNAVYLNGGASGIGGGVVLDGRVIRGSRGYAGEFGHNRPGIADEEIRRTPAGVFEDEVQRSRLLQAAGDQSLSDEEMESRLDELPELAAEVARQRRVLSTAVANVVNVLNPEIVVLGGFLAVLYSSATREFAEHVRRQVIAPMAEHLEFTVAQLRKDRLLVGAASEVFNVTLFRASERPQR